jgi:hypothetical protein
MEERPPIWKVAADILNKEVADSRQGVIIQLKDSWCKMLTTHRRKKYHETKHIYSEHRAWTDILA